MLSPVDQVRLNLRIAGLNQRYHESERVFDLAVVLAVNRTFDMNVFVARLERDLLKVRLNEAEDIRDMLMEKTA